MRKKKHGAERIAACGEYLLKTREDVAAVLAKTDSGRCCLEIGCGKGSFAVAMSQREKNFPMIAVERCSDVALLAMEKAKAAGCGNLHFLLTGAATLPEFFREGEAERIYLNFSDPWPKKGHSKRRLTHRNFLALYRAFLRDGGEILLKTDNRELFFFSLEEFSAAGFSAEEVCEDLHHSPLGKGNVLTEYERNFSEKGMPIYFCRAVKKPAKDPLPPPTKIES